MHSHCTERCAAAIATTGPRTPRPGVHPLWQDGKYPFLVSSWIDVTRHFVLFLRRVVCNANAAAGPDGGDMLRRPFLYRSHHHCSFCARWTLHTHQPFCLGVALKIALPSLGCRNRLGGVLLGTIEDVTSIHDRFVYANGTRQLTCAC